MRTACETVYIVDPDESVHDAISTLLEPAGVRVSCFRTPESLLAALAIDMSRSCCLLVEASIPGIGSLELIRRVRSMDSHLSVVVLASTSDKDIAAQALKAGATDVIDKPHFSVDLLNKILGVAVYADNAAAP